MIGFTRPPCDAGIIRATPAAPAALSRRRKQMTLAATILGSSMAFIDGSVVNIALPAIHQALQANAASTQWIVNGYLLLLGALVLVGGSAADLTAAGGFSWSALQYLPRPPLPADSRPTSRCSLSAARFKDWAPHC